MSEAIRCPFCPSGIIKALHYPGEMEYDGYSEDDFGWECSDCGVKAKGFDSFAAAEAHARGHLEAMLERLAAVIDIEIYKKRDSRWVISKLPTIGPRWVDESVFAAVEAALKELGEEPKP